MYSAAPTPSSSSSDLSKPGADSASVCNGRSAQEVLTEYDKYEARLNAAKGNLDRINECCKLLAQWSGANYDARKCVTPLARGKNGNWPKRCGDILKLLGADYGKITVNEYSNYFNNYQSNLAKVNAVARNCGMQEVVACKKYQARNLKDLPATRDAFEQLRSAMEEALAQAATIAKVTDTKVRELEAQAPGMVGVDKDRLKEQARNDQRAAKAAVKAQEEKEARERVAMATEDRLATEVRDREKREAEVRLQGYVAEYIDTHLTELISESLLEYVRKCARNNKDLYDFLVDSDIPSVRDQMLQKTIDLAKRWYQEKVVVEYTYEVFSRWNRESDVAMQNDLESVFVAECTVTGIVEARHPIITNNVASKIQAEYCLRMRTWNALNGMIWTQGLMRDFVEACGAVRRECDKYMDYNAFKQIVDSKLQELNSANMMKRAAKVHPIILEKSELHPITSEFVEHALSEYCILAQQEWCAKKLSYIPDDAVYLFSCLANRIYTGLSAFAFAFKMDDSIPLKDFVNDTLNSSKSVAIVTFCREAVMNRNPSEWRDCQAFMRACNMAIQAAE